MAPLFRGEAGLRRAVTEESTALSSSGFVVERAAFCNARALASASMSVETWAWVWSNCMRFMVRLIWEVWERGGGLPCGRHLTQGHAICLGERFAGGTSDWLWTAALAAYLLRS